MLGNAWLSLLERRGINHKAVDLPEFDIRNPDNLREVLEGAYATVVNCAAFTDVDGAETHEAEALALNGTALEALVERCHDAKATLIHYSTDYVFDGKATSPYPVDHPRQPMGAYGRTKAVGEVVVEGSDGDHLLIRTSWLYAPWANNFVRTVVRLAGSRDSLKMVDDQRGTPTSAQHLAAVSLELLTRGALGTFHVTDGGDCTWYDLAVAVLEHMGSKVPIEPCSTDAFPRPAPRPGYSVLDTSKTEELVGALPGWRANLEAVMKQLEG